jgi:hypothetical protein
VAKSKLAPEKVRATLREAEAVELRAAGVCFAKIGEKLEMSESGAYLAVKRVLERVIAQATETQGENVCLALLRLDTMLTALWPRVLAGDPQAVAAALRVEERRARMLGYDAPAQVAPTTPDGTEPWKLEGLTAEVRAEAERLMVEPVVR